MMNLSIVFEKKIGWSKRSFWSRFRKKPASSLYKSILVRLAEKVFRSGIKITMRPFFGGKMTGYLPDGNSLFMWGYIPGEEVNLTQAIMSLVKKGGVFFDIGAHFGYYTLLAGKLVGENGRVHAFEPTPRTFKVLHENCHRQKNIYLNRVAIMDKKGFLTMKDFGPRYASRNTYLSETIDEKAKTEKDIKEFETPTLTVDEYCETQKISPDFIKIDAEGAEYFILKGAEKTLREHNSTITIEVWGGKNVLDESLKAIEYLESLGYTANTWENNELVPHDGSFNFNYKNFIFVKR